MPAHFINFAKFTTHLPYLFSLSFLPALPGCFIGCVFLVDPYRNTSDPLFNHDGNLRLDNFIRILNRSPFRFWNQEDDNRVYRRIRNSNSECESYYVIHNGRTVD